VPGNYSSRLVFWRREVELIVAARHAWLQIEEVCWDLQRARVSLNHRADTWNKEVSRYQKWIWIIWYCLQGLNMAVMDWNLISAANSKATYGRISVIVWSSLLWESLIKNATFVLFDAFLF
jgi:hypothetical protein